MKLSEYAKKMGVTYTTAYRWYAAGKIPHRCEKVGPRSIFVFENEDIVENKNSNEVIIYARVSGQDQKKDLERQVERLRSFCAKNGYIIQDEILEIGSGMNASRPKLNKLLSNINAKYIVVENRDRLTRFGFEMLKSTLSAQKREIILLNETEKKHDLVADLIDMVTSTCAKIYGKRSAKNRAEKIKTILKEKH